ncbi:MAG TPA: hypothetical protein VMJ10_17980 [Kofleriaceae bacterium]|nr:hypothetical protein [Kofleriaceae bacterium]
MFRRTVVVVALLVPSAALADKLASIDVIYKRTITEQRKDVGIVPATCNKTTTGDMSLSVQVHVSSKRVPLSDDGNEAQVDGRSLDGGGGYDFHASSHTTGCKDDEDSNATAHADLDTPQVHFGFDYTRKTDHGNIVVDPQWKAGGGKGTLKSKDASVDTTKAAVAMAATLAGSMGNLSLNTAAQWASYGPAAQQLQQAMAMMAQDEPVHVEQIPGGGFQIGYRSDHEFAVEKIDPPPGSSIKRSGKRSVHTEVTITITPAH